MNLAGCCVTLDDKKKLVYALLYRKSNLKFEKGIIDIYSRKHEHDDPELYKDDLIQAEEKLAQNKLAYDTVQELELCSDDITDNKIWSCECCIKYDVKNELKKVMLERVESNEYLKELHEYRRDKKDLDLEHIENLDNNITKHKLLFEQIDRLNSCR